jgi:hemoglobin/transferrin/lactoferrin receptor protein
MLRKNLLGSASAMAAAVVLAFPAHAQEGEAGVTQLDTVTTIGTRTPKSIFETLGSVSRVGPEEIERKMPSTFGDIVKQLPNVDIAGGPRPMAQSVNIRGLGEDRTVLRLDGARSNFNAGHRGRLFADPDLIRSVEVLRGPGTTYGSGAIGGAVAAEFKNAEDFLDPGRAFGFRTKVGLQSANDEALQSYTAFGRYRGLQGLVSFTQRISSNVEAGPAKLVANDPDDRISEVPYSKEKSRSGLVKVSYDFAPNSRAFFTYTTFNDRVFIPTNTESNFSNTDNPLVRRLTNEYLYIWGWNHKSRESGWVDLNARAYYNLVRIDERVVQGSASQRSRLDETDLTTWGLDVNNTSRFAFFDGRVKSATTYGIEWYYDDFDGRRNGGPRNGYPNANAYSTGLYVQEELTLWDQFILLGALRWDSFDYSAVGQPGYEKSRLSKTIGLGWRPFESLLVYGKYAEGFRAPNLATELYLAGPHFPGNVFIPNPNLRPETSKTLEAGLALQFRNVLASGDRIWFKGAVFRSNIKDFIDFNLTATTFQAVNVPEARVFGAEGEAGYTSRYVFGSLALGYVIGENVTTGGSLSSIPAQKLVATIGGRLPEWDLVAGFRLNVASDQNRVPSPILGTIFGQPFIFQSFRQTSGYTTGDLFFSWVPSGKYISPLLRGLRLDAGIDNIWDKRYRSHLSIYPEAGINYKLALSYTVQFGGTN